MSSGDPEPTFVGAERHRMVEELLTRYDEATAGSPTWVSLEAGTGWGKTRLVHELYRRLAAERQPSGAYWPPSILGAVPEADRGSLATTGGQRKRIYPQVMTPAEGALPDWLWWGVGCAQRAGTPFQAIAEDLTQFEAHRDALERRWREDAGLQDRFDKALRGRLSKEVAEAGLGEGIGLAAGAVNLAFPGLGMVLLVGKWGVRALRDQGPEPGAALDAAGTGRLDLVDNLAPALAQLAKVVPVVVVVEDIHLADESLVELLRRLLVSEDARLLVVTTAWPGLLEEDDRPASTLLKAAGVEPIRLRSGAELAELEPRARAELARELLPGADAATVAALVDRYTNPLALRLATEIPSLSRAVRRGLSSAALVEELPQEVRGLYKQAWDELPSEVRSLLMLAALTSPAGVSEASGASDTRWDAELLRETARSLDWLSEEVGELDERLEEAASPYAWVRHIDEFLRVFHELPQHEIALAAGAETYDRATVLPEIYTALAEKTSVGDEIAHGRCLHQARLLVSLEAEGFIPPSERWVQAVIVLCRELAASPDMASKRELIRLADLVLAAGMTATGGPSKLDRALRELRARALTDVGRTHEALAAYRALLADRTQVLGPDAPGTLQTRHNVAHLLRAVGRLEEAIAAFPSLLDDYARVLGPDHPVTLAAKGHLTGSLAEAGRVEEAVAETEALVDDYTRVLGPDAPATIATRGDLTRWLGEVGRVDDAVAASEALLADYTRVLGPEAPATHAARANLAHWLSEAGRVDEAAVAFEVALAEQTRVLGPDAPPTFTTRNNLAMLKHRAGQVEEAVAAFQALVDDQTRVLGPEAPATLTAGGNLALCLGDAGRVEEAVATAKALLDDQIRVLGPDAPVTLATRHNLAHWSGVSGRVDDAVAEFEALSNDYTRVLGPDAPPTLTTRNQLAQWLGEAGQVEEAVADFKALVDTRTRVLGPDAPATLATRGHLAHWMGEAGRVDDAVAELEALLNDYTRVLGPDAPATSASRNQLARWSG